MKRAVSHCVDCGAQKERGEHHMTQRCKRCGVIFMRHMLAANKAINGARRRGLLGSAAEHACVDCGSKARDWDHRDYSKPLDVQPVCRSCNQKRGAALFPKFIPFARMTSARRNVEA